MRNLFLRDSSIPIGGNLARGIKGIAFFCPTCGNVWAKAELSPYETRYMVAANSPCPDHGDPWHIGGCVINPLLWWDKGTPDGKREFLQTLSPELLRYLALRKIEHILKGF